MFTLTPVCLNFRMFRHRITERKLTEVEVSKPNVVIPVYFLLKYEEDEVSVIYLTVENFAM